MELWIRSQDRKQLVKVYSIQIVPVNNGEKYGIITYNEMAGDFDLGIYKTKERALEVLDEIQKRIAILTTFDLFGLPNNDMAKAYRKVLGDDNFESASYPYQMPLE